MRIVLYSFLMYDDIISMGVHNQETSWGFNEGSPKCLIRENLDNTGFFFLGVPPFQETSIWSLIGICMGIYWFTNGL